MAVKPIERQGWGLGAWKAENRLSFVQAETLLLYPSFRGCLEHLQVAGPQCL